MWLVTWKLLTKSIKLEAILIVTLSALPHFKRKDFGQTWASGGLIVNGHFSNGSTFWIIQAKVLFSNYEWSGNCLKSLLQEIRIAWPCSMPTKERLGFVVYLSKCHRLGTRHSKREDVRLAPCQGVCCINSVLKNLFLFKDYFFPT